MNEHNYPCGGCGSYICSCPKFEPLAIPKKAIMRLDYNGGMPPKPVPTPTEDKVNNPAHYNHNWREIECIDAIEASMTPVEFLGYLKGNVMKYVWRYSYKNGLEDLEKSEWYKKKMIEKLKEYTEKKLIIINKKGLQNA